MEYTAKEIVQISNARVEVDTFAYVNSTAVQYAQRIARERQEIIDTYIKNLSA